MNDSGNLVDHLERSAHERGWLDRSAYLAEGNAFSFRDVYDGAGRAAASFAARGLERGSRIVIALPDGIDFVWAFLGALRIGAVAVLVNSLMHPDEVRRAGEIAEATAGVGTPGVAECFDFPMISPDELREDVAGVPAYAECDRDTPAFAAFTSGTTGEPRLCFHTHGDPKVFNEAIGSAIAIESKDVSYSVSRMYFAYGLGNSLFFPLLGGCATVLTAKRATVDDAVAAIEKHGVTVFYGQPSFYAHMLDHPGRRIMNMLRLAVVAGEVLPENLERQLRGILGNRLLNIMGTTEIGHALLANGPDEVREFTLGRVLAPYRLRIVDYDDREVPAGTEGRLQVAGPTIGPGVSRGGDAPLRLTADEWYSTGDAATIDSDGFVQLHGRLDDIEIVGGANVHPAEIENLLMAHPAVQDAAVCSVRRDMGASALRAFVVSKDPTARVRNELLVSARHALTWYKVPEDIVFVTELPRNSTGKLLRRKVRSIAESGVLRE
jgi:4-hydroxybenzoate adenylyltransferase